MRNPRWWLALCLTLLTVQNARAVFQLTVDPSTVGFGSLDPGQKSNESAVSFHPYSDEPGGWTVQLDAPPMALQTDPSVTFPAANFLYRFSSDFPGTETPPTGVTVPIPGVPGTIYSPATDDECSLAPCNYGISLHLLVDDRQRVGAYSTTVTFTLISNI